MVIAAKILFGGSSPAEAARTRSAAIQGELE
jgi:hypothetical protein